MAESQSKFEYEQIYGKLDVSVIRLRASDFGKDAKITDDDIAKYYEAHKAAQISLIAGVANGYLATPFCPLEVRREDWFFPGTEPTKLCPVHSGLGTGINP